MTNNDRQILSVLSFLLQYPDKDFWRRLRDVESSAVFCETKSKINGVKDFLEYLKSLSRMDLQERYTALFDLNPATTLEFTYHLWKENEKRAAVLSNLESIYRKAGLDRISRELPDHLPLMLEFLSAKPEADGVEEIWACLNDIREYVDRLKDPAPAYAGLLEPLVDIVNARTHNAAGGDHSQN